MKKTEIQSRNRETLRRLDKALSVSFIAMFIISAVILAFAVLQIMTAQDLRQHNSELTIVINNLRIEIEDLKDENRLALREVDQLREGIKHLKMQISNITMNEIYR